METNREREINSSEIQKVMERAVWQAVLRHKKLGESIAVWQGGRVVTLSAEEIEIPEDVNDL